MFPQQKNQQAYSEAMESVRTVQPWWHGQSGRSLTWDVTVVDTLASSYTPKKSVTPCGAVEAAATRKRVMYAEIIQSHLFVLMAIETLGPMNMDSLGERFSSVSGDPRETTFIYQRLSVLIQFSIRLPFVVLSFPIQLPKVNSRTRF